MAAVENLAFEPDDGLRGTVRAYVGDDSPNAGLSTGSSGNQANPTGNEQIAPM